MNGKSLFWRPRCSIPDIGWYNTSIQTFLDKPKFIKSSNKKSKNKKKHIHNYNQIISIIKKKKPKIKKNVIFVDFVVVSDLTAVDYDFHEEDSNASLVVLAGNHAHYVYQTEKTYFSNKYK